MYNTFNKTSFNLGDTATMQARLIRYGSSGSRASMVRFRCSCQGRQIHALYRFEPHVRAVGTAADLKEAAHTSQNEEADELEFEGLLPEEDVEVPGTYVDAMNGQTKLGKAVRAAVEELEHLGDLEVEVLQQCDDLLKQLGMKGSIFGSTAPGQIQDPAEGDADSSSSCSSSSSSSSSSTS